MVALWRNLTPRFVLLGMVEVEHSEVENRT